MDREQIFKEAQAFFFEAMLRGYADEAQKPIPVPGKPGFKQFIYRKGDWRIVDEWATNPDSDVSFGTTTIWYKGQVVWMMQYFGKYGEGAIPLLKEALKAAYIQKVWYGGRGPFEYKSGSLSYTNNTWAGTFEFFQGKEYISDLDQNRRLGWHEYHGMALI